MLNFEKGGYVYIDRQKAKRILILTPLTYQRISKIIGKSTSWLSQCLSSGRISVEDIQKIKDCIGVDLSSAVISRTEYVKAQAEKITEEFIDNSVWQPTPPDTSSVKADASYFVKIIEDYSYTRSNDTDRLIRSIDRLTSVLSEVLGNVSEKEP